jgi:hypothetical protein
MGLFSLLCMLGAAAICLREGYKLFCGIPAAGSQSRRRVFLWNIVPGALLALLGAGLLTAGVHRIVSHDAQTQRLVPGSRGAVWHHAPNSHILRKSV